MKRIDWRIICIVLASTILLFIVSTASAQTSTAYFLVAHPALYPIGLGDSYILPITDSEDIEMARAILAAGAFKIVFAQITKGSDGINRDMLADGTPEWSWHVVEFLQFGDIGIEICDGSPSFTEAEVQNWSEGQEEIICYWSYTIVEEVDQSVSSGATTWGGIKALYGE